MTPSKWKGVRNEAAEDPTTESVAPKSPWDHGSLTADIEEPYIDDAPSVNPTTEHTVVKPLGETTGDTPLTKRPPIDDAFLEPGTKLGEYRVDAKIGEGGMGVVYSAAHPLIGKRAAVKVLKAELCRSEFNVERFIDEARIVNQIGHPNIVDVFAFGQTADGRSYFVMEWLKGESLRDRIARSRLDLTEVCDVIRPLARALEAAHEAGVIHRDLKPDNIFLVDVRGDTPTVKLLDFGIAKLAREEHRMERTATGAMVGTPQYIAPEQAKGYAIDNRVDIYSLGGILFELLTGRPPFVADNAMEMVAKHLMEPAPRPSSISDMPPELDELVVRMLSKQPTGRPTLAEVATVIERVAALDRTNVKTPITPLPMGSDSEAIDIPVPTATSAPNLQSLRHQQKRHSSPVLGNPIGLSSPMPQSNPQLAEALAKAKAMSLPGMAVPQPPTEMTETIRSPRPTISKKVMALAGIGFLTFAFGTYFIVSIVTRDTERKIEAINNTPAQRIDEQANPAVAPLKVEAKVEPPKVEPKVEPPKVEPKVEPPKVEPKVEPPKVETKNEPKNTRPEVKPPKTVKPPKAPPPPTKKPGKLNVTVSGAKGTPQILVDGKLYTSGGELEPGTRHVVVSIQGMKPFMTSVTVEEGKSSSLRVTLEPKEKDGKDGLMQPGQAGEKK